MVSKLKLILASKMMGEVVSKLKFVLASEMMGEVVVMSLVAKCPH
jgi:hypothetical protein